MLFDTNILVTEVTRRDDMHDLWSYQKARELERELAIRRAERRAALMASRTVRAIRAPGRVQPVSCGR